jgi:hypothetical protein
VLVTDPRYRTFFTSLSFALSENSNTSIHWEGGGVGRRGGGGREEDLFKYIGC